MEKKPGVYRKGDLITTEGSEIPTHIVIDHIDDDSVVLALPFVPEPEPDLPDELVRLEQLHEDAVRHWDRMRGFRPLIAKGDRVAIENGPIESEMMSFFVEEGTVVATYGNTAWVCFDGESRRDGLYNFGDLLKAPDVVEVNYPKTKPIAKAFVKKA